MPTIAITFDYWPEAINVGMPIMRARSLPATFFVATESGATDLIDYPGYVSSQMLADAEQGGWEIGIYSNTNMATMLGTLSGTPPMATAANALATKRWMLAEKDKLKAKGFVARSYAPNGRVWNTPLANLSRDIFDAVRVCDDATGYQTYPIPDKNYVRKKAIASMGQNDTLASFSAEINNAILAGNVLATFVFHKVGAVADPYTVSTSVFTDMMDFLVTAQNAGSIRVVRFADAMTAP